MGATFRRHLLLRMCQAMGLTVPVVHACGGMAVVDGESPGDGSGAAGTATSASSVQASSAGGGGCTETTTASTGGGVHHFSYCFLDGSCPAAAEAHTTIAAYLDAACCTAPGFECERLDSVVCGPYAFAGKDCCWEIFTIRDECDDQCGGDHQPCGQPDQEPCTVDFYCLQGCCQPLPGRPLRVAGRVLTADAVAASDWSSGATPQVAQMSEAERRALADRWQDDALIEHASIASFARLSLALLAFGAPAELVADAQRAALDEVEHARDAFALASGYRDAPCGPSAMPTLARIRLPASLAELAIETFVDGCINETLAAIEARERFEHATDPVVRDVLAKVVADETRHAELAWRTVAWALREGGADVREALSATLHAPRLDAHLAMRDVVEPCARALLAS